MSENATSTKSSRTALYALVVILALGGAYAGKRFLDKLEPPELQPQQQYVKGHWQRDLPFSPDWPIKIYLPEGYTVELVTDRMSRPRMMFFDGDQLLVGSQSDHFYRLDPPYNDPVDIGHLTDYPHSALVRDGYLYVTKMTGLYRIPYTPETDWIEDSELELVVSFKAHSSHNSRTVRLGPDNRLYVSMGWPKNCSNYYVHESYPPDFRMGGILLVDETGPEPKLVPYASGLRNPVDFDWHPDTGMMYATNNGPDHLGYGQPPEYFARVTEGSFHGMPWYQFDGEKLVVDECADFPAPRPIEDAEIPAATFDAHSAPLGMTFVKSDANLVKKGDAIVALHGSWVKKGGGIEGEENERRHPKLALVKFENGEPVEVQDLVSGFQLPDGRRWATPADVAIAPNGDIYFTSDRDIQGLFRVTRIQ